MALTQDTSVVILAGGLATRIRPISEKIPKCLIEVNGKPFVDYQLTLLAEQGFQHFVFCVGFLGDQVEQYVSKVWGRRLKVEFCHDGPIRLGTGGATMKALALTSNPFLLTYGDAYLRGNYQDFLDAFEKEAQARRSIEALLVVFRNSNEGDRSNVRFEGGEPLFYDKKNPNEDMKFIDWGVSVWNQKAFESCRQDEAFDLADLMHDLSLREAMAGFEVNERFYEIGSFGGIDAFKNLK